jgi:hypothetical protein
MTRYLLSVHSVEGEVTNPMTGKEMQQSYKQVPVLKQEMKSAGVEAAAYRRVGRGRARHRARVGAVRQLPSRRGACETLLAALKGNIAALGLAR